VPRGRTFEVSYRFTEPKKVSQVVYRILFRFGRSVRNLKGSSPGHRFGKVPIFFRVNTRIRVKINASIDFYRRKAYSKY
jgi:hypothetical protein